MAASQFVHIRKDENFEVLAEHPDRINPRALSSKLSSLVGRNNFKVSLRRNIYVIYLYRRTQDDYYASKTGSDDDSSDETSAEELLDFKQRLKDFKLAKEKLREARLSRF